MVYVYTSKSIFMKVKRNYGYKEKLFVYFSLQPIEICLLSKSEKLISKSLLAKACCANCNTNFDLCYYNQSLPLNSACNIYGRFYLVSSCESRRQWSNLKFHLLEAP